MYLTIILDARPRGCLPDILQLPVQRSQLAVRETAASAVELNLRFVEIRLEDLSRMAPGREVRHAVRLVWHLLTCQSYCEKRSQTASLSYWIPALCRNRHLTHTLGCIWKVGNVEAPRRIMPVAKLDSCGIEVEFACWNSLLPCLQRRHGVVPEFIGKPTHRIAGVVERDTGVVIVVV